MIVDEDRAVFLEDIATLVIADLHIGYEEELAERGIIVPPQWGNLRGRMETLVEKYGAKKLVILGDLKHEILRTPRYLREFLRDMDVEIHLAKGNHDGGIEDMVDFQVHPPSGFRIGRYGFFHGHSHPSPQVMGSDVVFMGHLHPEVSLPGSTGKGHRMPCLLKTVLTRKGIDAYNSNPRIYILPVVQRNLHTVTCKLWLLVVGTWRNSFLPSITR